MKVTDYSGNKQYLQDRSSEYPYKDAISVLDEENLNAIADDMGIEYINMSKQSNIDDKLREIKDSSKKELNGDKKNDYTDIYYIFVIPLVILLIWEFINYKRKL